MEVERLKESSPAMRVLVGQRKKVTMAEFLLFDSKAMGSFLCINLLPRREAEGLKKARRAFRKKVRNKDTERHREVDVQKDK